MYPETANRFYESNKKYFFDKITILDLALAAMEGAIREAYEKRTLEGAYVKLEDFRDKQTDLIFEEVMRMDSIRVEEASREGWTPF